MDKVLFGCMGFGSRFGFRATAHSSTKCPFVLATCSRESKILFDRDVVDDGRGGGAIN